MIETGVVPRHGQQATPSVEGDKGASATSSAGATKGSVGLFDALFRAAMAPGVATSRQGVTREGGKYLPDSELQVRVIGNGTRIITNRSSSGIGETRFSIDPDSSAVAFTGEPHREASPTSPSIVNELPLGDAVSGVPNAQGIGRSSGLINETLGSDFRPAAPKPVIPSSPQAGVPTQTSYPEPSAPPIGLSSDSKQPAPLNPAAQGMGPMRSDEGRLASALQQNTNSGQGVTAQPRLSGLGAVVAGLPDVTTQGGATNPASSNPTQTSLAQANPAQTITAQANATQTSPAALGSSTGSASTGDGSLLSAQLSAHRLIENRLASQQSDKGRTAKSDADGLGRQGFDRLSSGVGMTSEAFAARRFSMMEQGLNDQSLPKGVEIASERMRAQIAGNLASNIGSPSAGGQQDSLAQANRTQANPALASGLVTPTESGLSAEASAPSSAGSARIDLAALASGARDSSAVTETRMAQTTSGPSATAAGLDTLSNRFGSAIAQQIMGQVARGQWQTRLAVHPANLGPIDLKVHLSEGVLDVEFRAQHAMTRDLLQESLPRLRELLENAGYDVGRLASDAGSGGSWSGQNEGSLANGQTEDAEVGQTASVDDIGQNSQERTPDSGADGLDLIV